MDAVAAVRRSAESLALGGGFGFAFGLPSRTGDAAATADVDTAEDEAAGAGAERCASQSGDLLTLATLDVRSALWRLTTFHAEVPAMHMRLLLRSR